MAQQDISKIADGAGTLTKTLPDPVAGVASSSGFAGSSSAGQRHGSNRSRQKAKKHLLRDMAIIFYNLLPGTLAGFLTVYLSMLIGFLTFFYDINNLFYPGLFIVLLTTCVATLPIALLSGFPGASASVSNTNAVLMGLLVYQLIIDNKLDYSVGGSPEQYFDILLVMATVGISVAVMYFMVGVFSLSRIFSFAPEVIFATIQVVIAMMMVLMAFSVLTGELVIEWSVFINLVSIDYLDDPRIQFALGVGIFMAIVMSMFSSQLVLPILLIFVLFGFHLWARGYLQMDVQDMIDNGWLLTLGNTDVTAFAVSKLTITNLTAFDFSNLRTSLADIIVICTVLLINSLEVTRRLEETVEAYTHPAREITAVSFSSVLSAFTSGFSVHHSLAATVLTNKLGAHKKIAGIMAGVVCGLVAFFGLEYVQLIPIPMVAATLICYALQYFIKWVIRGRRNLDLMEYLLVIVAAIFTFTLGYNAGLIFGLLSGAVVFMLTHSKISGIKRVMSGKLFHSSTERLPQIVKVLDAYGDAILIIQLEATLLYGMMYEIIHMVVGRTNDARYNPLGYILLDFSSVRNLDVTVLDQMNGLFEVAEHHDIVIVVCGLHHNHAELFKKIGFFDLRRRLNMKIMPTLDVSLEWCEDNLLNTIGNIDQKIINFDFDTWLADRLGDEEAALRLQNHVYEEVLQEGENISQQYAQSDKIYFIKSGSVEVSLDMPNHERIHLRKLKEGALIGELGFYLGVRRNVNIIALETTVTMSLDRKSLTKISRDDPVLMLALHRMIAIYLSTRISYVSRMLQVLISSDEVEEIDL